MDLDHQKIWLEETNLPMLVEWKDKTGTGGADAVTQAEKAALEDGERLVKGPMAPRPQFRAIDAYGFGEIESGKGGKSLGRAVMFRAVQTSHDDEPRRSGRAYLYFWPGGLTERASIQVHIGSDTNETTLTLLVSPLTGRVTVKAGPVDLKMPTDDSTESDRADTGY
jgi:general secretion pathway protein H